MSLVRRANGKDDTVELVEVNMNITVNGKEMFASSGSKTLVGKRGKSRKKEKGGQIFNVECGQARLHDPAGENPAPEGWPATG